MNKAQDLRAFISVNDKVDNDRKHRSGIDLLEMRGYKKIKSTEGVITFELKSEETYRRYGNIITIHVQERMYSGFRFNDDLFNSRYTTSPMTFDMTITKILLQILEEL